MPRKKPEHPHRPPADKPAGWTFSLASLEGTRWGEAMKHLGEADPGMARLIDAVGPCRLEPTGIERPFEALVETIVYQQLTGKAAQTIFNRVCALFRGPLTPNKLLGAGETKLRTAGLSGPKIRSIVDLCERVSDKRLQLAELDSLSDTELAERLIAVKGIGPWSVQMIMIFRLGRPDVWPVGDLGIRKGAQRVWGFRELPDAKVLERAGKALAPYRSIASWYLWRSLEIPMLPGSPSKPRSRP